MANAFENGAFQFFMLFALPVGLLLWGLWELMGPVSYMRYVFPTMNDNDPALMNSVFYFEIRAKGIMAMAAAAVYFLALRRGDNRLTLFSLLSMTAGLLAWVMLFLWSIRTDFATNATSGVVLALIFCFVAIIFNVYFVLRHCIGGSGSDERLVVRADPFFIWSVILAPVCFLAFAVWEIAEPSSFLKFFFPGFGSLTDKWIYDSAITLLITRMKGIMGCTAIVISAIAIYAADTRTAAQVKITCSVAVAALLIAYAEIFDVRRSGSMAGPVVFFVACGGYLAVTLGFLYSFYFLGHKRESIKYSAPLYNVGSAFEYSA